MRFNASRSVIALALALPYLVGMFIGQVSAQVNSTELSLPLSPSAPVTSSEFELGGRSLTLENSEPWSQNSSRRFDETSLAPPGLEAPTEPVIGQALDRSAQEHLQAWTVESFGNNLGHNLRPKSRPVWLWGDPIQRIELHHDGLWCQGVGRGYYINDQRWEFTGQEATFGVEGIIAGGFRRSSGEWNWGLGTELYVNQPFDDNILVDAQVRRDYAPNFDIDTLEISQLTVDGRWRDLQFTFGKFVTPFGKTHFPILSNNRWDTPFVRSEAILWRETGLLAEWRPERWQIAVGLTNGSEDQDTNSSKALVARIGWASEAFELGASIKEQDGIGSEGQKYYNSHTGLDMSVHHNRWTFSSEVIYDKYGYRRAGFAPDNITWARSLYHRDQFLANLEPINGWGYYVGALYRGDRWLGWVSYGQFLPESIGDPIHDQAIHRFFAKGMRELAPGLDAYLILLQENEIAVGQDGYPRRGTAVSFGIQASY